MWKRKRKAEWLPWYRARNYKGNLTEAEKRELDAFRTQPKHPAAEVDNLPEEVQGYINRIESELYDQKQDGLALKAFCVSAFGAAVLFLDYKGCLGAPSIWYSALAVFLMVWPWIKYRYQWKKNAEAHVPSEGPHPTDEGIRQEWELTYLVHTRRAERDVSPG